jgi:ERCC4-type nuclease
MKQPLPSFTVLVDSREKRPLAFPSVVRTEVCTLPVGDYSIVWDGRDLRDVVVIERKSASDLLSCIGRSRERFERELARMAKIPYRALVIEGSLSGLLEFPLSRIHPNAVLGSLVAWTWRYGVPPIFAGDRCLAAAVVRSLLVHGARVNVHGNQRGADESPQTGEQA